MLSGGTGDGSCSASTSTPFPRVAKSRSPKENEYLEATAARAVLGFYFLGQLVAGIAGAEEQEPVRHGLSASVHYKVRAMLKDS